MPQFFTNFDKAAGSFTDTALLARFAELRRDFPWNPNGVTCFSENSRRETIRSANRILAALGFQEQEADVVWTSGATEALNLAIGGFPFSASDSPVACDRAAHPAMLEPVRRLKRSVHWLNAFSERDLNIPSNAALVCVCLVNNETGAIWPPDFLNSIPVPVCMDITQAIGKITNARMGVCHHAAMLAFTGRKLGTPVSVGALVVRKNIRLKPMIVGGGQQGGLRSGTLDAASCSILAEAVENAMRHCDESVEKATVLTGQFKEFLDSPSARKFRPVILSPPDASPFIFMLAFPGYEGALVARIMAQCSGVLAGTGSACSAESASTSHVLESMDIPEELARCAIRISFGPDTTETDFHTLQNALLKALDDY